MMMTILELEKVMLPKTWLRLMNMIRGAKQLPQYTKNSFKLMRKLTGWDNKCLNDILFAKF